MTFVVYLHGEIGNKGVPRRLTSDSPSDARGSPCFHIMAVRSTIPPNLPALLLSRPKRLIIENKQQESIVVETPADAERARPVSYLVSRCEHCSLDFGKVSRLTQIMFEDCGNLSVSMCSVIGSVDIVKCEVLELSTQGRRGTICLDMAKDVCIKLDQAPDNALHIYSSSCSGLRIAIPGQPPYVLVEAQIRKACRSKTWYTPELQWKTEESNLFGDTEARAN